MAALAPTRVASPSAVEVEDGSRGEAGEDEGALLGSNEHTFSMGYLLSRIKIVKAINEAPSAPKPGKFDLDVCLVPVMDVLGVQLANASVSRMVQRGWISREAGTFLNGVLAVHAYCITHACAHGGASQGHPNFQELERTAYRLAVSIIGLDDDHRQSHKRHHAFTNSPWDPDLGLETMPLDQLGPGLMAAHNSEFDGSRGKDSDWLNCTGGVLKSFCIDAFRRVPELAPGPRQPLVYDTGVWTAWTDDYSIILRAISAPARQGRRG